MRCNPQPQHMMVLTSYRKRSLKDSVVRLRAGALLLLLVLLLVLLVAALLLLLLLVAFVAVVLLLLAAPCRQTACTAQTQCHTMVRWLTALARRASHNSLNCHRTCTVHKARWHLKTQHTTPTHKHTFLPLPLLLPLLLTAALLLVLLLVCRRPPRPPPPFVLLLLLLLVCSKSFGLSVPLCSDSLAEPPDTRRMCVGCRAVAKARLWVMATMAPPKPWRAPVCVE